MQQLGLGIEYEIIATPSYSTKYESYQYNPSVVTSIAPTTIIQQKRFLESIITERQTEILLNTYPDIVNQVINNIDNIDLNKLSGIGLITWNNIKEKIMQNYVISDILILLSPLGISYGKIKKLLSDEPNPYLLKKRLIDDPYTLTSIRGLGFKSVDKIAMQLNSDLRVSVKRLCSFLTHYFYSIGDEGGNTWVTLNQLQGAVRDNINECMDIYEEFIVKEKADGKLLHIEKNHVGLASIYKAEKEIFNHLIRLKESYSHIKISDEDIRKGIEEAEKDLGYKLSEDKIKVIWDSIRDNVIVFSGKSGTGKSSLSNALLKIYKNYNVACCALSAKAAQRIIELTGFPSFTIHRLLGFSGTDEFIHNEINPLPYDIIFVDECSMINLNIFLSLLRAVRSGCKIIMCGDDQQLPPIGSGNVFSDLLLMKDNFKSNLLTKVHRQAANSGILIDSNMIRDGVSPIELPELKIVHGESQDMIYMFRKSRDELRDIAIKSYLKAAGNEGTDEVVIITPRKKDCINSTAEINKIIQDALVPKDNQGIMCMGKNFRVGTKVIQRANDYERDVINGETGYVKKIIDDKTLVIEFRMNDERKEVVYNKSDLEDVELAYALTVHSIQGSQANTIITIIDNTHYILLDTCLLYTALTRAKKRCVLLAEPKAYRMCISNNKSTSRQTWLKTFNKKEI